MKTIKYFSKAQEKINARGLELAEVTKTCLHPEQIQGGKEREENRTTEIRKFRKGKQYLLRVIFEESEKEIKIVTAYKTSKIKKYWRDEE